MSLPDLPHNCPNLIRVRQFRFAQVSEIEVFLLLESLDTNKSLGIDKIHPLLLKPAALQIYRPLTFIFNLSINQGIFPDSMKLAKVVPIFKQGSRFECLSSLFHK